MYDLNSIWVIWYSTQIVLSKVDITLTPYSLQSFVISNDGFTYMGSIELNSINNFIYVYWSEFSASSMYYTKIDISGYPTLNSLTLQYPSIFVTENMYNSYFDYTNGNKYTALCYYMSDERYVFIGYFVETNIDKFSLSYITAKQFYTVYDP